jgi:anti-anti-sigma factor
VFLAEAVSPQLMVTWGQTSSDCAVLQLQGELELCTAPLLRRESECAQQLEAGRIVLDLSRVSFIDSAGMGALVSFYKRLALNKELAMVAPLGVCRRQLERVQLTRLLATYDTVEDALATAE